MAGREKTSIELSYWIKKVQNLGAGELIIIFIDNDGMNYIPDVEILKKIKKLTNIPTIYGGGISKLEDIEKIYKLGYDGVCISRSLHCNKLDIIKIKKKYK